MKSTTPTDNKLAVRSTSFKTYISASINEAGKTHVKYWAAYISVIIPPITLLHVVNYLWFRKQVDYSGWLNTNRYPAFTRLRLSSDWHGLDKDDHEGYS